ncbi:hypothetical protein [Microbulbifer halophilus]|uniref:Hydroxymethylglutaryl-CoA reductase (NADPH) n=1 Tax=Microbulbifer halophilus TaxID=453963 RepID=A0ABW5ECK6_9GAMM|nr:hypothetical protein [Microbulbifer halophilus]MCW8126650.1 hypothetical protein [Microbulbifer halophilus]
MDYEVAVARELDGLRIPAKGEYSEVARQQRLGFLREKSGLALEGVGSCSYTPEALKNNIESLVGTVEVPLAVVGPVRVKGVHVDDTVYVPCATTEGALVASLNRGATALFRAGGVTAWAVSQRVLRAPYFEFFDLSAAQRFCQWVGDNEAEVRNRVLRASDHAELLSLEPVVIGRCVHLTFEYRSGDASGQNMVTACTWSACNWIREALALSGDMPLADFAIEAGLSGDKRVTGQTFTRGRGTRVTAECVLPADVVRDVLKVEPSALVHYFHQLSASESAAGSVGCCLNIANPIAAVFVATGQDIACVHESSAGVFYLELQQDGNIYASITLPCLVVGTVGGGTGVPQQRECLQLMGCAGSGKAMRFAECIAACCMGLELSTMSAVASDQFAQAHERMGRNRPA